MRPVACGWHVEENAAGRGGVEMTLPSLVSAYIDIIYRIYIYSLYILNTIRRIRVLILLGTYYYIIYIYLLLF